MFYDNLKSVCNERGLKITPIVEECGGAKGSVSNWKKGVVPGSDIVIKLSARLNVTTDRLLLGKTAYTEKSEWLNEKLPADRRELLQKYEKLSEREQGRILERIDQMLEATEKNDPENVSISSCSDRTVQTAAHCDNTQ